MSDIDIKVPWITGATRALFEAGYWSALCSEAQCRSEHHRKMSLFFFVVGLSLTVLSSLFWSWWPCAFGILFLGLAVREDANCRVYSLLSGKYRKNADDKTDEHARLNVENALAEHISQRAIGGVQ